MHHERPERIGTRSRNSICASCSADQQADMSPAYMLARDHDAGCTAAGFNIYTKRAPFCLRQRNPAESC